MSNFVLSPNMSMPVPVVGVAPGPDYAQNQNACFSVLDSHDHSPGKGAPITPDGININGDLPLNGYNLTSVRSVRFSPQASLSLPTDLGALYVSGVDAYFKDLNGNNVRLTQSGGVAGSPGSISGLTSPASASYQAGISTFVWQSAANTPANLDAGSVVIRKVTSGSPGITVSAPTALSSNYTFTLPIAPPASVKMMTMDSTGNLAANYDTDNSTLEVNSNNLRIKDAGVTTPKIADASVTFAKMAPGSIKGLMSYLLAVPGTYPWVVPANCVAIVVTGCGGGGGGGAGGAWGSGGSGGGGGAGVVPVTQTILVTPGETLNITVGSGGSGGIGLGVPGSDGGFTFINRSTQSIYVAAGGSGGGAGASGNGPAGAGGTAAANRIAALMTNGGAGGGAGSGAGGQSGAGYYFGGGSGGGGVSVNAGGGGGGSGVGGTGGAGGSGGSGGGSPSAVAYGSGGGGGGGTASGGVPSGGAGAGGFIQLIYGPLI